MKKHVKRDHGPLTNQLRYVFVVLSHISFSISVM